MSKAIRVFWFRRDLRLEDNIGLARALKDGPVLCLFIFDSTILDALPDRDDARVSFIHQRIESMHQELRQLGSGMTVFYGEPLDVFRQLLDQRNVSAIYTNEDYEPYAVSRDQAVAQLCQERDVAFHLNKDQCVFHRDELLTGAGKPYTVYTPYKRKWLATLQESYLAEPMLDESGYLNMEQPPALPTLADMGFNPTNIPLPGTEYDADVLQEYDQLRDYPARDATSHLGIHLRFGTLSIRQLVRHARDINMTWLSQLIWRDFFMQILHHFPYVAQSSFRSNYDRIPWRQADEDFERWKAGQTGYPIVDAGMRELARTGYMHNRVRMITASFLCKHLLIDWRRGEAWFAQKLLDFDLAANNGNWQWAAGSGCDAAPYFRVFNPWIQTKKFDPEMAYIKRWVPEYLNPSYPAPMVDHATARQRAIDTYKRALSGPIQETTEPDQSQASFDF